MTTSWHTCSRTDITKFATHALAVAWLTTFSWFGGPTMRRVRLLSFSSAILDVLIVVISTIWLHGFTEAKHRISLGHLVGMSLCLLLGGGIYMTRVSIEYNYLAGRNGTDIDLFPQLPEKRWPKYFDIIGASHQIFHASIVVAAVFWCYGLIAARDHALEAKAHPTSTS